MRRFFLYSSAYAAVAVVLGVAACSVGSDCDFGMCSGPQVGNDGEAPPRDGGHDATPVDECLNKPDAPECLDESKAFFVSSSKGNDATGDGSKAKPFKSVTSVLDKVSDTKRRIYICEGDYPEDVVLEAKHAGASLFGGFTCDWSTSKNRPKFGNTALALKITGATGVAIADIAFVAKDATSPGASSIAAFVANSDVTFKRVSLTASNGAKGDNGGLSPFTFPADLNGTSATSLDGGAEKPVRCPADPVGTVSTKGGNGGVSGAPGGDGTPGQSNKGSVAQCDSENKGGGNGAAGAAPPPAAGASVIGMLAPDGWHPAPGVNGSNGGAGQGGGGGAGLVGGAGGGGGAGGCGGAGGGGGQGGGASIALVSFQSSMTFEASSLTSSTAGAGGDGVAGQPGQTPGGSRGTGSGTSCNGGNGGKGGDGAPGGGGAGGGSVGVGYKGSAPTLDTATTAGINAGTKGGPGNGPGNAGIDGASAPTLEIK